MKDLYEPIKRFGYFLMMTGIAGLLVLFIFLIDVKFRVAVWVFISTVSLFHFLLGAGIVLRKKAILPLFRAYLRLLYLGFPLGTLIAKETLRYIEKNNVENLMK